MPDISICCTCYNHEKFIAQALESMLMQKGDFTYEILVHDDASTDSSASIIEYYHNLYPDIIKPIYQSENQYSNGVPINESFNFPRAEGKYIALCEGDDYWTDEYKLLKQYLYMEYNSECTFCFSNAIIHDMNGHKPDRKFVPYYEHEINAINDSGEYDLADIFQLSFIPTASFMFKTADVLMLQPILQKPFPYGDMRYKLLFTSLGYAYFLNECTCVYRENVSGSAMNVWSKENRQKSFDRLYSVYTFLKDLDRILDNRYTDSISKECDKYINYCLDYLYSMDNFKLDGVKQGFSKSSLLRKLALIAKLALS